MSLLRPLLLLLILIVVVVMVVGMRRINELFVLRVRGGRLRLVRGYLPRRLRQDIEDVVKTAGARDVQIRGVVEDRRCVIYLKGQGIPKPLLQRLRNTISLWPLAKIRQGS